MKITLRWPTFEDIDLLKKAYSEAFEDNFPFLHYFETLAGSSFEKYIQILPNFADKDILPTGHVPCTFLLAFNDVNEIVGRVSIRHELNDFLFKIGGHVGYAVVPSQRKKGYATQILSEALQYVRIHLPHLKEILLTCDDDNIGSIKTIEKNQGQFIDLYEASELRVPKRRYRIHI